MYLALLRYTPTLSIANKDPHTKRTRDSVTPKPQHLAMSSPTAPSPYIPTNNHLFNSRHRNCRLLISRCRGLFRDWCRGSGYRSSSSR